MWCGSAVWRGNGRLVFEEHCYLWSTLWLENEQVVTSLLLDGTASQTMNDSFSFEYDDEQWVIFSFLAGRCLILVVHHYHYNTITTTSTISYSSTATTTRTTTFFFFSLILFWFSVYMVCVCVCVWCSHVHVTSALAFT